MFGFNNKNNPDGANSLSPEFRPFVHSLCKGDYSNVVFDDNTSVTLSYDNIELSLKSVGNDEAFIVMLSWSASLTGAQARSFTLQANDFNNMVTFSKVLVRQSDSGQYFLVVMAMDCGNFDEDEFQTVIHLFVADLKELFTSKDFDEIAS